MRQRKILGLALIVAMGLVEHSAAADLRLAESPPPDGPLRRLLDSAQGLFRLESLGLAVLEDFASIRVQPLSHFSSFFPNAHHSTRYSLLSVPEGFSTNGASLVVTARFSPRQWISTALELPIADSESACLSEALLRKHFGTDYKQSRPTHTPFGRRESYSYTTAHLHASFSFDYGCAARMNISESTATSRQPVAIARKKPPDAMGVWHPTLKAILKGILGTQLWDVESVTTLLKARLESSSKSEWFTGDRKSKTEYWLRPSNDGILGLAHLTFESTSSPPSPTIATLRIHIRQPDLSCIGQMDPVELGAAYVGVKSQPMKGYAGTDLRAMQDTHTYRTPERVVVELTFLYKDKDCASWLVVTKEL